MDRPYPRYLSPQDIHRLRRRVFVSHRPVHGLYAGPHASLRCGRGVEFSDSRPYAPGDSPADVDWKAFGRSDRLIVRQSTRQSDMSVHLLLDASASMAYGDPGATKFDYAARLAAALAFLLIRQRDPVGLGIARRGLRDYLPPRCSQAHLSGLLLRMEWVVPEGPAGLADAVARLAALASSRGVLLIFTDLLEESAPILRAMAAFAARGGQGIVCHVVHPHELDLPAVDRGLFIDNESPERLTLHVRDAREAYRDRFRAHLDGWATALGSHGVAHHLFSTTSHPLEMLDRCLLRLV